MQYATHYEEGKKVSFKKFDLNLAGLLFLPDGFDADAKYRRWWSPIPAAA